MDNSETNWLSEWIDEDLALSDETFIDDVTDPLNIDQCLSSTELLFLSKRNMPQESSSIDEKPLKRSKIAKGINSSFESEKTIILASNNSSSSSIAISFAKESASPPSLFNNIYGDINILSSISDDSFQILGGQKYTPRTGVQAQDHVLAERKRRERFSQQIMSLSALIPKLTKMDKTTVLSDATNYIKELKERVKVLEGKAKERNYVDTAECFSVLTTVESDGNIASKSLPEIKVNIFGKNIVTWIHSKNQTGFIVNVLTEIEKLKSKIISNNVVPFANNTQLLTTIISQIDDEFNMTANDVAQNLHSAIQGFL